jgi:hypothetical protein
LILFLDDDVTADRGLVSTHLRIHQRLRDPKAGVLGHVAWHPELRVTPFMQWLDRSGFQFAYDTWLRAGPVDPPQSAFYTANLSLHRDLIREAGGFDERFPYANYEDMELAFRMSKLGFRLLYDPAAKAFHARNITLKAFARRMANEAESAVLLQAIHPDFGLDTNPPRHGAAGRRRRLKLRVTAPLAGWLGRPDLREQHFRAEIAAAYGRGLERGARRFAENSDDPAAVRRE